MHRLMIPLAACALALAACGGSDNSASSSDRTEEQALKFARCMREHGVDVPDPKPGSAGRLEFRVGGPGRGPGRSGPDPQRLNSAMQACRRLAPNGGKPPSKAQQQEMLDRTLRFARCMREHGIDFPDPKVTGGGGVIIGGPHAGFNPSSPAFQKAQEACRSLLPKPPGGGDGGPGVVIGPGQ